MKDNENTQEKKTEGKSLFIYTALIFLVAIFIVVFSYFSQESAKKKHGEYVGEEASYTSLSDRISKMSDENMILLETTKNLEQKNSELVSQKGELEKSVMAVTGEMETYKKLIKIFNLANKGKKEAAAELLKEIPEEALSEEVLKFYDYLKKELKENLKEEEEE